MSPDVINIGGGCWSLVLTTRSNGSGDAKVTWDASGQHEAEFHAGFTSPAAAIEVVLSRIDKNGGLSPLDVPALVGVLTGYFQRRG